MSSEQKQLNELTLSIFETDAKSRTSIPSKDAMLLIGHIRYLEQENADLKRMCKNLQREAINNRFPSEN